MENKIDSKTLAIEIAKILDKKKAVDVRVLKVESLTVLTDYFVISDVICVLTGCFHLWVSP